MGRLPFSPEKTRQTAQKDVVVCIGGMAGSGKSTVAKKLAKKYGLRYVSGGDALRTIAVEKGYTALRRGWWEGREGMRFLKERSKDERFDEEVDRNLLELARQGNVILDSWTMPWLVEDAFKMWLEASPEKRAKRIAGRDGISFEDALSALRQKEKHTKAIYKRLYGFRLGEDFAPFNFVLDTENMNSAEVFRVICIVMEKVVF